MYSFNGGNSIANESHLASASASVSSLVRVPVYGVGRPDDWVGPIPESEVRKKTTRSSSSSVPVCGVGRPDDWVGRKKLTTTRSWRVKGSTKDSIISNANEQSSDSASLATSSSSVCGFGRPDDWVGRKKTTKSWRVKGGAKDSIISNANESSSHSAFASSSSVHGFGQPDDWVGGPGTASRKKTARSWRVKGNTKDSIIARNDKATPAFSSNDAFCQDSMRSAPTVMFRNGKQDDDNDDDDDDDNDEFGEESNHEEEFGKIGDDEQYMPLHLLESSMSSLKFNDSIGDFVIETTKDRKYGSTTSIDFSMHSVLTEDDSKSRFSEAMEMWHSTSSINSNTAKTTKKEERSIISNRTKDIPASFLTSTSAPSNSSARSSVMDTAKGQEIRCSSSRSTIAASYSGESISEFEESFVTAIEDYPNAETGSKMKNESKELYKPYSNRTFKSETSSLKNGSCCPKDTLHLQSELSSRNRNIDATVATSLKSHSAARAYNRPDSWIGGSSSLKSFKAP